jgi:hypothetical protein
MGRKRIEYTAGDFIGTEGLIFIEDVDPYVKPSGQKSRKARFLCTCGKDFESVICDVKDGSTQSCGCVKKEVGKKNGITVSGSSSIHWRGGISSHYLYGTWESMMQRCFNESRKEYEHYGGRGITVCPQWQDSKVFLEFCDTVLGERPEGHTLDRIDNDRGYFPDNVRWADAKTQSNNQRGRIK